MPGEQLIATMATYHEELAKAGALLDASGLQPSSKGFRIRYSGDKQIVIDGPFTETKEVIAGYTVIPVKSRAEAMEWARRFPNPAVDGKEGEIEVRQLFEPEDFASQRSRRALSRNRDRDEEVVVARRFALATPFATINPNP